MTYLAAYAFYAAVALLMLSPWIFLIHAFVTAPEGWQDREGFHVGSKIAPKLDQFSYTGHDNAGAA